MYIKIAFLHGDLEEEIYNLMVLWWKIKRLMPASWRKVCMGSNKP